MDGWMDGWMRLSSEAAVMGMDVRVCSLSLEEDVEHSLRIFETPLRPTDPLALLNPMPSQ